jgi:hypothetical protein
MEQSAGILTPQVRRQMQQGIADCASCRAKAAYLREIGLPNEELEQRAEHTATVIQAALDIDESLRKGR